MWCCVKEQVWVVLVLSQFSVFSAPYLQIEEMQAVQLVEDVMRQGSELAAVHVEALELLKPTESSSFQPVKVGVVPQVQLLQVPELTESPCLNPGDVVGEKPQNLQGTIPRNLNSELFYWEQN